MTVQQLIDELKKFPLDIPVTILDDIWWNSKDNPEQLMLRKCTWISNHPYDKPDFEYINIE